MIREHRIYQPRFGIDTYWIYGGNPTTPITSIAFAMPRSYHWLGEALADGGCTIGGVKCVDFRSPEGVRFAQPEALVRRRLWIAAYAIIDAVRNAFWPIRRAYTKYRLEHRER